MHTSPQVATLRSQRTRLRSREPRSHQKKTPLEISRDGARSSDAPLGKNPSFPERKSVSPSPWRSRVCCVAADTLLGTNVAQARSTCRAWWARVVRSTSSDASCRTTSRPRTSLSLSRGRVGSTFFFSSFSSCSRFCHISQAHFLRENIDANMYATHWIVTIFTAQHLSPREGDSLSFVSLLARERLPEHESHCVCACGRRFPFAMVVRIWDMPRRGVHSL